MGLLQSLGLAGASKAVRRLLQRSSRSSSPGATSPHTKSQDASLQGTQAPSHLVTDPSQPVGSTRVPTHESSAGTGQDNCNMLTQKTSLVATPSGLVGSHVQAKQRDQQGGAVEPSNKENQRPAAAEGLEDELAGLGLGPADESAQKLQEKSATSINESDDPAVQAEKARHQRFTEEALDMARLALRTNETPVGCVLVHNDTVIARGMNATNVTRNGTRHAEFMALTALLSYPPKDGPRTTRLLSAATKDMATRSDSSSISSLESDKSDGNDDGSKGHLYPYGQKLHPDPIVDQAILHECVLYVTVEPCVMCASLLRQFGIKKVYFGAVNDKFGGTGGVFSIHANSDPNASATRPRSLSRQPPPLVGAAGTLGESFPVGGGDGGNVEKGYEIEGGWGRDEAVGLLRRFYVQENGRAPVPRKKEGRAARLAAIMDRDGPDAVCAALLEADGMLPAPASPDEVGGAANCGDLIDLGSEDSMRRTALPNDDTESDKENAPLRG